LLIEAKEEQILLLDQLTKRYHSKADRVGNDWSLYLKVSIITSWKYYITNVETWNLLVKYKLKFDNECTK